jgi:myo-inositol 2-dehydrogenase/D-chiro-inositol 1-dehydrogenase
LTARAIGPNPPSNDRTRIALVGCGKIAEKHLNAYRKLPQAEVTVSDIVSKGRMIAENYGVAWHDDPEELIGRADIDAVDVCTPTPSHAGLILQALASGKHVFCEKPLARDLDEMTAIAHAAEEAQRRLMVGYPYRFHPALQFGREVVLEGIIGEPYFAILRLGGRGSHKAWKHMGHTGGGVADEMLVHMLDILLWYFGEFAKVDLLYRDLLLVEREIEGSVVRADADDALVVKIEMENGVKAICQADLVTPGYMNYVEVQGTNGSLLTSILDYLPTAVFCKEPRGVYELGHNFFDFPRVDLFERELEHFLNAIAGDGGDLGHSVAEALQLKRMLDSATLRARETAA